MMPIGEQDIENMLVTSIVCEYGIKRKQLQKHQNWKKHLSIPFKAYFKLKSILIGWDYERILNP